MKWLILAPGPSLKEYKAELTKLFNGGTIMTIGVNNMDGLFAPDYHMFTATRRYRKYWKSVRKNSTLVIPRTWWKSKKTLYWKEHEMYETVRFENKYPSHKGAMKVVDDCIVCEGATVAMIAAGFAVTKGATEVYIGGLDGYKDVDRIHFYENESDENRPKFEAFQSATPMILRDLNKIVPTKIITPTSYGEFYDRSILA